MGVLRLDGTRLYFQAAGEGPPVVLIHGLGSSGADWEGQVPEFSKHFRTIVPDLRGHGGSARAAPYTIAQFAADTWALLGHLGIEQPVLIGHSMGGAVAMQMTLDRPGAVRKLVLASTLAQFRPRTLSQRWMMWSRLLFMRMLGPRRLAALMIEGKFPRPDQADLRRRVARRNARNDPNAYTASLRSLAAWDIVPRLRELRLPVLVLSGELDFLPAAETAALVAALPDGKRAVFPGVRHELPLEAPAAFNAAVLQFLRSPPAPDPIPGRRRTASKGPPP